MSPITCQSRKPIVHPTAVAGVPSPPNLNSPTAVAAAAAAAAAYQLSYSHFYAARAAFLGSMTNSSSSSIGSTLTSPPPQPQAPPPHQPSALAAIPIAAHLPAYLNDLHNHFQHQQQQQQSQHDYNYNNKSNNNNNNILSTNLTYLDEIHKSILTTSLNNNELKSNILISPKESTTTRTPPLPLNSTPISKNNQENSLNSSVSSTSSPSPSSPKDFNQQNTAHKRNTNNISIGSSNENNHNNNDDDEQTLNHNDNNNISSNSLRMTNSNSNGHHQQQQQQQQQQQKQSFTTTCSIKSINNQNEATNLTKGSTNLNNNNIYINNNNNNNDDYSKNSNNNNSNKSLFSPTLTNERPEETLKSKHNQQNTIKKSYQNQIYENLQQHHHHHQQQQQQQQQHSQYLHSLQQNHQNQHQQQPQHHLQNDHNNQYHHHHMQQLPQGMQQKNNDKNTLNVKKRIKHDSKSLKGTTLINSTTSAMTSGTSTAATTTGTSSNGKATSSSSCTTLVSPSATTTNSSATAQTMATSSSTANCDVNFKVPNGKHQTQHHNQHHQHHNHQYRHTPYCDKSENSYHHLQQNLPPPPPQQQQHQQQQQQAQQYSSHNNNNHHNHHQQQQQQHQQPHQPYQQDQDISSMSTNPTTCNFKKGSYIQLSNGNVRRVEDMRTEDFIQCAEKSPTHQLTESTVVKINDHQANVTLITFSYDKARSKAQIEVAPEHPFFVYGQGWASCNPELSMKIFNLKCQRLQVGDICISLTERTTPLRRKSEAEEVNVKAKEVKSWPPQIPISEPPPATAPPLPPTVKSLPPAPVPAPALIQSGVNFFGHSTPSGPAPHAPTSAPVAANPTLFAMPHLYNPYLNFGNMMPPPTAFMNPPGMPNFFIPHQLLANNNPAAASPLHLPTPPVGSYLTPFLQVPVSIDSMSNVHYAHDDEASNYSKKRRWSAPENNCDDEQPSRKMHINEIIMERNGVR